MNIRRREVITLLGGVAAAWPVAARGQQPTMPVIGFLNLGAPEANASRLVAFRTGLSEAGYVDGQNVAIEYRWARNEIGRLPELAADLVRRRVAVIAAPGSMPAALAAKAATTTIPIVFSSAGDPVQTGLVASLNQPGGNVTGVSDLGVELSAKRLGLLHELLPGAVRFAILVNETFSPSIEFVISEVQGAASAIGLQIEVFRVSTNPEIDTAFTSLAQKQVDALLVNPQVLFVNRRAQILTLAARHAMPVMYPDREFAETGGLMSYGSSVTERDRQAGIYTGRVLKGEKPADLPILRASKFEFVINLQTARIIGLDIPATLLARADELIE